MTISIARLTEQFINAHPSVKDCVRKGLINYSALSREICIHYKLENFDAVLIACRRYYSRIKNQQPYEQQVLSLLRKAKLQVRNKMVVVVVEKPKVFERLYSLQAKIKSENEEITLIEGQDVMTIITSREYLKEIRQLFQRKVKKIGEHLAIVSMVMDPRIETTHGVVAHVYSLLSANHINVLEEMSCWTDLMIVVEEKDLAKTMEILSI